MPYNSAHHCVVEVENFLFVLGGEDQWNPNGMYRILKGTGSICLPVSVCWLDQLLESLTWDFEDLQPNC